MLKEALKETHFFPFFCGSCHPTNCPGRLYLKRDTISSALDRDLSVTSSRSKTVRIGCQGEARSHAPLCVCVSVCVCVFSGTQLAHTQMRTAAQPHDRVSMKLRPSTRSTVCRKRPSNAVPLLAACLTAIAAAPVLLLVFCAVLVSAAWLQSSLAHAAAPFTSPFF